MPPCLPSNAMECVYGGAQQHRVGPAERRDVPAIADLLRGMGWFSKIEREPTSETLARVIALFAINHEHGDHTVLVVELVPGRGGSALPGTSASTAPSG